MLIYFQMLILKYTLKIIILRIINKIIIIKYDKNKSKLNLFNKIKKFFMINLMLKKKKVLKIKIKVKIIVMIMKKKVKKKIYNKNLLFL